MKRESQWVMFNKVSKEDKISAILTSDTYSEVFRKLGCKPNFRNRDKLRNFCNDNNLSYEHLIPMSKDRYYENPKTCKTCGKIIPYEKRENEFCSRSCSATYSNLYSDIRKKKNEDRKESTKERKIKEKAEKSKTPSIKRCPICGTENCESDFCKNLNIKKLKGLSKLGFNTFYIGTPTVKVEFDRVRSILYREYWIEENSVLDLAKKYNIKTYKTLYNLLSYLNIPRRSLSDSCKLTVVQGKWRLGKSDIRSSYKHAFHTTWDENVVYLRSSYELDYAIILDSNKIHYEVESFRIEYYDSILQKDRIAIPDFYLPDTNEIVEIKSDFTLDIQEMLDKFNAYKRLGYVPKLILEHEEIDLYNIENIISLERLEKIKKNVKIRKLDKSE